MIRKYIKTVKATKTRSKKRHAIHFGSNQIPSPVSSDIYSLKPNSVNFSSVGDPLESQDLTL